MNKYFKDFLNSSTSMSKFVIQLTQEKSSEALEAYTRKIFRKFQDELINAKQYIAKNINVKKQAYCYRMREFDKEEFEYILTFVRSSTTTTCSCHMFDFLGIMCRHELIILIKKGLSSLLNHCILNRWTKDVKKGENITLLDPSHVIIKGCP
uniref:Protein FAR1-RELATED SEQUENCE n=1 Tax=Gossypium raimondii TaxID=29730 RepID=A0A0D2R5F0_GOSRA|nr:hypothetical protein B456_002G134300 [Gossypium raimondii]